METLRFKKFRIDKPVSWNTHRGGWRYVVDILQSEFHTPDGTLFLTAVEDVMKGGRPITEPWTGFIHQVPRNNLPNFPDLERLLKDKTWLASLKHCQGIFTISNYLKEYLDRQSFPFPVNCVPYAVDFQFKEFDYDAFVSSPRNLLFVGEFMRNFQAFSDLDAKDYRKLLLVSETFTRNNISLSPSVTIMDRVSDEEYDSMLASNIVFLNLLDAPANTTVVECLARNTPILINKLPGVVDYLGQDYPFYYSSLEEAARKLSDEQLIRQTVAYLRESPNKEKLRKEYFINAIHNGSIYRSLPIPRNQKPSGFEPFDVTVVITSYKRLYNIDGLLDALCRQEFEGSFEVILWNNNIDNAAELDNLYQKYREQLTIRLIHSTENYYCAMRLAMGHLMQGEHLLICDDDVVPGPNYITTFWNKFHQYGQDVVLCARGHLFEPHELDEQHPEKVWETLKGIRFYDESVADTYLHFFHADNCFIPKSVLLKLNAFELDNPDFILVDDYWMSYIISHELRIPILKIQLDAEMAFTPCADDKGIALFHNPKVRKERVNFYVYHMKKGWPNSIMQTSLQQNGSASRKNNTPDTVLREVHQEGGGKSIHFKSYDLSVVICSYSRIHHLAGLIERFQKQDFSGTFELIIWNNNVDNVKEIDRLYAAYKDLMEIKVIHSVKNYFCMPRIALTGLLRGNCVVWCDDDIIIKPNYLSHLYEKHQQFGPNALVCISGHTFLSPDIDENLPHLVWEGDGVVLHTVDQDEMLVSIFHGNSCILSKELMRKAATFRMPTLETGLVDDYWLSYVLSQELGARLVKIKGDAIMSFADDANGKVAMWRNRHVRYQKIVFHLYHRRKNWIPVPDRSMVS